MSYDIYMHWNFTYLNISYFNISNDITHFSLGKAQLVKSVHINVKKNWKNKSTSLLNNAHCWIKPGIVLFWGKFKTYSTICVDFQTRWKLEATDDVALFALTMGHLSGSCGWLRWNNCGILKIISSEGKECAPLADFIWVI